MANKYGVCEAPTIYGSTHQLNKRTLIVRQRQTNSVSETPLTPVQSTNCINGYLRIVRKMKGFTATADEFGVCETMSIPA